MKTFGRLLTVWALVLGAGTVWASGQAAPRPTPDRDWDEIRAAEFGSRAEQAGAQVGRAIGQAARTTGQAIQSAAAASEADAADAGRQAGGWFRRFGRTVKGFFQGFGEGLRRQSE